MTITHPRTASFPEGASAPLRPATTWRQLRRAAGWLGVTLLAIVLAAGAAVVSLRPPGGHIQQLVAYLAMSGFIALALGAVARWILALPCSSSIRLQLAVPPVLTVLVIAVTTLLLAHGMFIS